MAKKSSFFLAVLFIANPFVLLFYQNCSVLPQSQAQKETQFASKKLASETIVRPTLESKIKE